MRQFEDIDQLQCPSNHSQRKTIDMFLGSIVKIKNGKSYKHLAEGSIPVYGSGGVMTYVDQFSYDKPSVLIPRKGSLGNLFYLDKPFWNVDTIFYTEIDTNLVVPKFLFYLLQVQHLERMNQAGGVPSLTQSMLNQIQLTIPPLEEQERIVAILDKYSSIKDQLTKQLDLEIELTLKQYEYYRDDLLSFKDSDTKWLAMGDIGEFIRGNGLQKKDFVESGVGCIHYGEIYTHYGTSATETKSFVSEELAVKLRKAKHGDLVIATTSENVDDVCKAVAWMGQDDICISGDSYLFKHNQHPKYLAYLLQTQLFSSFKQRVATGTKVMRVSGDNMSKFQMPIPSLAEQERIVAILDKYSNSVDKLVSNLRREKDLVQKQYEYYREKLLTF